MGATYTIDGNALGAIRAFAELNRELDKTEKAAEKAARQSKSLEQQALRIKEAVNPQEQYNRKMRELVDHVNTGRLKLVDAQAAARKYGDDLQQAGNKGKRSLDDNVRSAAEMVAGLYGVSKAVGVVIGSYRELDEAAKSSLDSVVNSLGAIGELQQLGDRAPAALAVARQLVRSGAVPPQNLGQAVDISANLFQANLTDEELQFIAKDLAASRIVRPENLAKVGGNLVKIRNLFGAGDLSGVTARGLSTAQETLDADFASSLQNILLFAPLAASTGASADEAFAAFEVAEQRSATPASAAENLKSLFSQVYRRNLSAGDLQGTLANIQSKITKGKNAFDILGDANAVIGFDLLTQNLGQLTRREAEIGRARFEGGTLLELDPVLSAAQAVTTERGLTNATNEQLLVEQQGLFDAVQEARKRQHALQTVGRGTLGTLLENAIYGVRWATSSARDVLGGNFEVTELREALGGFGGVLNNPAPLAPENRSKIEDYLRRIEQNQRGGITTRSR